MPALGHGERCGHEVMGGAHEVGTVDPDAHDRAPVTTRLDRPDHSRLQVQVTTGPEHRVALANRLDGDLPVRRAHHRAGRQALVVVADDGDLLVVGGQRQGDLVLGLVGVLVLVDQDVAEALLVVRQHLGVLAEQAHRVHQQVVEVHRAGLGQAGLVLGVDLRLLALERVGGPGERLLRRDQLVLPQADLALRTPRREPLGVQPQVADHVAGQPLRIALVVDAEAARVAQRVAVDPQDAHARGVERADPHRLHPRPHQRGHAVLHLVRRLVGERDGEDRRRRHPVVHQVGDPVGEDTGLAGTGAGHHQQRPATVDHGVQLVRVERGEVDAACGRVLPRRLEVEQGRVAHGVPILGMGCDTTPRRPGHPSPGDVCVTAQISPSRHRGYVSLCRDRER